MINRMTQETKPTPLIVSVTVLSQMFLYLTSLNIDAEAFLRSLGVDPEIVKSPDGYIPVETYLLIEDGAADYTHDPYFGLHMGEFAEAGSWSILGYDDELQNTGRLSKKPAAIHASSVTRSRRGLIFR
jgi:hypothetical protein